MDNAGILCLWPGCKKRFSSLGKYAAHRRWDHKRGEHVKNLLAPPTKRSKPSDFGAPSIPPGSMVVLTSRTHNINGVKYGPGRLVVPEDIGRTIAEADGYAERAYAAESEERAFIVGPRGSVQQVNPEYLDNPNYEAMPTMATVSGRRKE